MIDYRSDFYSLGISFYQMISGNLPYDTLSNVIELIHSHIAQEPTPLPSHVPTVLSNIIFKLMQKTVDDRYQSTAGLLHDLQKCKQNLVDGTIERFPIAEKDFSNRFIIPKKVYGRDREVATLTEIVKRVYQTGKTELVLLHGGMYD